MSEVFISYVHEDQRFVLFLTEILKRNGVKVWLDKDKLTPGVRWKDAIRSAIKNGTFFVSIHSKQREMKGVSYVNEELVLAIDELRKRPANRAWFIPVTIDDCEMEDRSIGGGETLADIQRCDLSNWGEGINSLLTVLGVANPIADFGVPLAPGLPSAVDISSGYVRYDVLPDLPEFMQGLEFRVAGGWCQRQQDGSMLAYIETVAPMRPIQEINKMFGLSGFLAHSTDRQISDNPDLPTKFQFSRVYTLPQGVEVFDIVNGNRVAMPFDVPISTHFTALGAIDWMKFSGTFEARLRSDHKLVPFSQNQRGAFELVFAPASLDVKDVF